MNIFSTFKLYRWLAGGSWYLHHHRSPAGVEFNFYEWCRAKRTAPHSRVVKEEHYGKQK